MGLRALCFEAEDLGLSSVRFGRDVYFEKTLVDGGGLRGWLPLNELASLEFLTWM